MGSSETIVRQDMKNRQLAARIKDGEVMGWYPPTLDELNADIDSCIAFLQEIKSAIQETRRDELG